VGRIKATFLNAFEAKRPQPVVETLAGVIFTNRVFVELLKQRERIIFDHVIPLAAQNHSLVSFGLLWRFQSRNVVPDPMTARLAADGAREGAGSGR
jgi:hypothetical protein